MSPTQVGDEPEFGEFWTVEQAIKIPGNSSAQTKQQVANSLWVMYQSGSGFFAEDIIRRLKFTEVSMNKKLEDSSKTEGRLVCEIDVTHDMLNWAYTVHGGCTAYLIDVCTSLATITINTPNGNPSGPTVSQALNIVFHGPAQRGDRLRLINTTIAFGGRVHTLRCEMWNVTAHRLVATAVHVKMFPSAPKL